ncbi:hypothetical protein [Flavisolibacter ginsenosidimutans]|uniref:Uncharacterized protein n=1 Tax=Flavisolibacter ginsenosidimutans TaxID=661481 RepID=A0A5B8UJJ9_9BACT|nr:hypothetical protein [Flavisolibacter ginsenosidimutans]QEC56881.1 hypothetical protein FSB75_13575 [Flavisolibacter ginsenosidimutans]
MTQSIIDTKDGELRFAEKFVVSKQTTPQEVIRYFGQDKVVIRDMNTGWKHYSVRNAKVNDTYFIFTLYFDNDILKMLDFLVSDEVITAGSWDDWSERKELEKRDYYNEWLTKEIGNKRNFPWGTIGAFYDTKGGGSSIVLRYE